MPVPPWNCAYDIRKYEKNVKKNRGLFELFAGKEGACGRYFPVVRPAGQDGADVPGGGDHIQPQAAEDPHGRQVQEMSRTVGPRIIPSTPPSFMPT